MTTYNVLEVNKIIRKCLKEAFPGVKFSVKKDRWTINISYTDGPNTDQVKSIVDRFQGSGFDGMTDWRYSFYHEENGSPVNLQTDFIFIDRSISEEKLNARKALPINAHLPSYDLAYEVRKQFNKISYCFTQESKTAARFACVGSQYEDQQKAAAESQAIKAKERKEEAIKQKELIKNKFANKQIRNKPISVLVHWSESNEFKEEQNLPFSEFERICKNIVLMQGDNRGYDKTRITVTFEDGDTYHCRLDLSATCDHGYIDHINNMIDYSSTEKGRKYYLQHNPEILEFLQSFYVDKKPAVNLQNNVVSILH